MSWDKKAAGRKYYYRCKRVNGRAVKQYIGRGPLAERAARQDEQDRAARHAGRSLRQAEQAKLVLGHLALKQARSLVELLASAVLILGGFHRHHGEWRRRHAQAATQG